MKIKSLYKFYKRYEIDLYGSIGLKHNKKLINNFLDIKKNKEKNIYFLKKKNLKSYNFLYDKENYKNIYYLKNTKLNPDSLLIKKKNIYLKKEFSKFVYRIDTVEMKRKHYKTSLSRELFIINRKLKSFYGNIKSKQLLNYIKKKKLIFKIIRGYKINNLLKFYNKNVLNKIMAINSFFSQIEHRLDVILYRSNFVKTIYNARHLIKYKKIYINNNLISFFNYKVNNFDLIKLNYNLEFNIFKYLKKKLKNKKILNYSPNYLYINYKLMLISIIKDPIYKIIPFPFKVDLKKWLGLVKMNV